MKAMSFNWPYREADALMAVRPSPRRSYTTPSLGWRSFQFTTVSPGNGRGSGAQVIGSATWSG